MGDASSSVARKTYDSSYKKPKKIQLNESIGKRLFCMSRQSDGTKENKWDRQRDTVVILQKNTHEQIEITQEAVKSKLIP